ncbi:MAG TPA: Hsp20/alpha crystallin family protein [Polyangia bacterium]|jgi:HSP20 family protein
MANLIRRDNQGVSYHPYNQGSDYRWDPFRVVDALLRFDPFRAENSLLPSGGEFTVRFDVKETKDAYLLRADVPGVKEDAVEVSLNGNLLTISGKREEEHRNEGEQYFALERSHGTFTRSFALPDNVDAEGISAELKHGVLSVQIPKQPQAQPRKIAIGKPAEPNKVRA